MLLRSLQRPREERGAALVAVVVLLVICFTAITVVTSTSIFGQGASRTDQQRLQAFSAAEAGRDKTVATLRGTTMAACQATPYTGAVPGSTNETYSATVYWVPDPTSTATTTPPTTLPAAGCPPLTPAANQHGWIGIRSTGSATGGAGTATKTVTAWYDYTATIPPPTAIQHDSPAASIPIGSLADGGIIEGGDTALNLTSPVVHVGDAVLNTNGTINCNNGTEIQGDLVLPRGGIALSNTCHITGSLIAYGDISLLNTTTAVGGDIVSTHGSVSVEGAQVNGNVKAYGGVTFNNSVTVGGDVTALGNGGNASMMSGSSSSTIKIAGSVYVGGAGLSQLDLAKITGSVNVSATGVTKIGSVVAPKASSIKLVGTCAPCSVVAGTTVTQKATVAAPTFPTPAQMSMPTWADYSFTPKDWTNSVYGYQVIAAKDLLPADGTNGCNYQGNTALINKVNALATNTVVDARACTSGLQFYGVAFALKAHVAFIAPSFSGQTLRVTSSDSKDHYFSLITPDDTADGKPTCTGGTSTITAATMDAHISGMAYTPCELDWGSAGGTTTQWNGQIMAGNPKFSGNGSDIYYYSIGLPGGNNAYPPTIAAPPVPAPTIEYVPSTDPPTLTMAAQTAAQTETGGP